MSTKPPAADNLVLLRDDPAAFVKAVWGAPLEKWQTEALRIIGEHSPLIPTRQVKS